MKRVNKKRNNFNVMVIKKQTVIFRMSIFLAIVFIISYIALLFFNVQYAYAIKDKENKISNYQDTASTLQSEYLSQVNLLEKDSISKKYIALKKVVYLDNSLNRVAFQTNF